MLAAMARRDHSAETFGEPLHRNGGSPNPVW